MPDPLASLQEAELTLETVAAVAISNCHTKVFEFCISIGANVNDDAIRLSILDANRLDLYKIVIAAGFDLNHEHDGTIGGTLIWATLADHIPLAKYLLEKGADPNRDLQDGVYRPLAKAAEKNNVAMIELFIKYGAQINSSGALIVAAEHGNLDAVRCLISYGANIDLIRLTVTDLCTKTGEEESALHKAVKGGHEDVVTFLVESGAQLGLTDHWGRDALMIAVELNNAEVFDIIYSAQQKLKNESQL